VISFENDFKNRSAPQSQLKFQFVQFSDNWKQVKSSINFIKIYLLTMLIVFYRNGLLKKANQMRIQRDRLKNSCSFFRQN